jgi:DNA-binding CsgD family transcriptional regulator
MNFTPMEDRICKLVKDGNTNKQIAGALLMDVKGVEQHLTRIYHKMGFGGRGSRQRLINWMKI